MKPSFTDTFGTRRKAPPSSDDAQPSIIPQRSGQVADQRLTSGIRDDAASPLVLAGGITAVLLLGALGAWASTMTVASAALAPGFAIAEGHRKAVQARDSAPVKAILVKEGDRVAVGQPLIELDLSDVEGEVSVLTATRLQFMARRARLGAERDQGALAFPHELEEAAADDPQVRIVLDQERSLLEARKIAYDGSVALIAQKIAGAEERITGLTARLEATRRQLDSVLEEKRTIEPLADKGVIARTRVLGLDRDANALQAGIEGILTEIAAARNATLEGKIEREQVDKALGQEISKELSDIEANLSTIEPRLVAANQRLKRSVIRSPEDGYVYELAVFSSGATVLPGQTLMEIVPADEALVLKVEISPKDIERVHPGQEADIHLIPYNRRYQSLIRGTLERVSADLVTDERAQRSYYTGIVSVDPDDLVRADAELLPGMPAEVMINAGDRTIAAYFLDPILRVYDRALKEQ